MGNTAPKQAPNSQNKRRELEEEGVATFTCEICIEPDLLATQKFKNSDKCVHPFCTDCVAKYIQAKLEDNAATIKCPGLNCEHFLDPLSCRPKIPSQLFDRWCDVLCESAVLGLDRAYCPFRECSVLVVNECGGNVRKSKCPNCNKMFCFKCKIPWHAGYGCGERELRDANEVALGVLAEQRKWSRCPGCHNFVERIDGCNFIICRCGTKFCYKCGKKMGHHFSHNHESVFCNLLSQILYCVVSVAFMYFFIEYVLKYKEPSPSR